MPEFSGLCGRRTITRCRLVWENGFKNRVGVYPSDLLPSQRTTWHATSNATFTFTPPLVGPGDNFGLPILGVLGAFNFAPPQFDTFTPQSHFIIMFAQVANRIDAVHIVTQAEIESMNADGVAQINVGEFVLEAIAATEIDKVVTQAAKDQQVITADDLAEMERTIETKDDKLFRKLFNVTVPGNRLVGIKKNVLAIEYRLDNAGTKVSSAFGLSGTGEINTPSYNDGSSQVLLVNLKKLASQSTSKDIKAGDKIYLSYIAVKEHYIRQSVEIAWQMQAIANPPDCFGFPVRIKVANYRFFTWNSKVNDPKTKLSGWRVVETFNLPVSFTCPIGTVTSAKVGDLIIGNQSGDAVIPVEFLPGDVSFADLEAFQSNPATRQNYSVNLDGFIGSVRYHTNSGIPTNPNAYRNSSWWGRNKVKYYQSAQEASEHVLFNVHGKSMYKRDVDKFGINRFMAQEIEVDIKAGSNTFFPFMDDASINNPTNPCKEYLSSSNTLFKPVLPVGIYTIANAEIDCGVGGAIQLGYTGNPDNVIAAMNFNSNFISERFDVGTKILVERHYTFGQIGKRFVALQGAAAGSTSLSCIMDPSQNYNFIVHINDDGYLCINKCVVGYLNRGMRNLAFKPIEYDKALLSDSNPDPGKYQKLLGYNQILGDAPGFTPGLTVSISEFADPSGFLHKTTRLDNSTSNSNTSQISFSKQDNRIVIPVGTGYYGELSVTYTYTGNEFDILVLFKDGNNIESSIDTVSIANTNGAQNTLRIPHSWLKGSSVELVGSKLNDVAIDNIELRQLNPEQVADYLETHSFGQNPTVQRGIKNGVFIETDIISIAEDSKSRLFIFFNDKLAGVSCVQSDNFGQSWYFQYGIVQPIKDNAATNPFVISSFENNSCFIFYSFLNKVMCKKISLNDFNFADAFVIENFENHILITTGSMPVESKSKLTNGGQNIRHKTISYMAIGDKTDTAFGELFGKDYASGTDEPNEIRQIVQVDDTVKVRSVRKAPIGIGANTVITNRDIDNIFFSAYRTNTGTLRLWFIGPNADSGKNLLQCHFSQDDGISWQDAFEHTEHKSTRIRFDTAKKSQFIDRSATSASTAKGNDPLTSNEGYAFGVNILGTTDASIDAPYAFYQSSSTKVMLFFVYKDCLLCKHFDESIFQEAQTFSTSNGNKGGMQYLKEILENQTVSFFIDGAISNILPEISGFVDAENNVVENGKIVFHHRPPTTASSENKNTLYSKFDDSRAVAVQRFCAIELPNGYVRVFYKHTGSKLLSAAIWNGNTWSVEDMLTSIS